MRHLLAAFSQGQNWALVLKIDSFLSGHKTNAYLTSQRRGCQAQNCVKQKYESSSTGTCYSRVIRAWKAFGRGSVILPGKERPIAWQRYASIL